jgi:hypothetical protein
MLKRVEHAVIVLHDILRMKSVPYKFLRKERKKYIELDSKHCAIQPKIYTSGTEICFLVQQQGYYFIESGGGGGGGGSGGSKTGIMSFTRNIK